MTTLGGKIAKKDKEFKQKKKDKKLLPKILVDEKNRLTEALKKNKYLKNVVEKYEKKIKKLTKTNQEQKIMLKNIVDYLEELEKDKKVNNSKIENIRKDKDNLLKKLKAIEIDLDILSG
jgi:hypothetical protein